MQNLRKIYDGNRLLIFRVIRLRFFFSPFGDFAEIRFMYTRFFFRPPKTQKKKLGVRQKPGDR